MEVSKHVRVQTLLYWMKYYAYEPFVRETRNQRRASTFQRLIAEFSILSKKLEKAPIFKELKAIYTND